MQPGQYGGVEDVSGEQATQWLRYGPHGALMLASVDL